jgi:hypothetical protein
MKYVNELKNWILYKYYLWRYSHTDDYLDRVAAKEHYKKLRIF